MSAVLEASYNHGVNHLKGYVFFTISKKISMHLMESFHLLECLEEIIVDHNQIHADNIEDAKGTK